MDSGAESIIRLIRPKRIVLSGFPAGTPHGVALAKMARLKRPGIKVLFVALPDLAFHTEGIGEVLAMPVTVDQVVAKVRGMMGPGG